MEQRALVVGGTSGIGWHLARLLAGQGISVTVTGRHFSAKAQTLGMECIVQEFTVQNAMELGSPLFRAALDECSLLCLCYGPFEQHSLAQTECAAWERMALLNYALPGAMISRAMEGMKRRGSGGSILLFGGTGTHVIRAYKTNAAYAGAKTGLGAVALSAAQEGEPYGIRCNMLVPGYVTNAPRGAALQSAESVARTALELLCTPGISGRIQSLF